MRTKGNSPLFSVVSYGKEISGFASDVMRHPIISGIGRAMGSLVKRFLYTSTRAYGYFFETFGIVSLLLHLAKYYFLDNPTVGLETLIISAVLALAGIPLILVDKPLCIALQNFPFTDYLLFEFFSIKRMRGEDNVRAFNPIIGAIAGLIPAALAFFFPIENVLLVIAAIIITAVSLVSPEFLFILLIIAIPYAKLLPFREATLAVAALLLLVSFFRKVMLGKRVMMVGLTDLFVLLFVLSIIVFGVIGGGGESTEDSFMIAALALGYFPAANIIVNRRLADCSANAFIIAALPAAVIVFVDFVISLASGAAAPSGSVMSLPYNLAVFLLAAAALCIYYISVGKDAVRWIYFAILIILFAGLFATWCAPVLIILPLSAVSLLLVKHTSLPREVLLPMCALPLVIFLLPPTALYGISTFFGMDTPLGELKGMLTSSINLFTENLVMGLGADATAASDGAQFNMLIGIGCRFGIFAVSTFVLLILFKLRRVSVYSRYLRYSSLEALSSFTLIAVFSILALGWFYDVTASVEIYFVIFVILGMNTASLRVSKKEYDDMMMYFGDNRGFDSSVADVTIKNK